MDRGAFGIFWDICIYNSLLPQLPTGASALVGASLENRERSIHSTATVAALFLKREHIWRRNTSINMI
jgi:hypothetical protein